MGKFDQSKLKPYKKKQTQKNRNEKWQTGEKSHISNTHSWQISVYPEHNIFYKSIRRDNPIGKWIKPNTGNLQKR